MADLLIKYNIFKQNYLAMIIWFFTLWQRWGHEKKAPRVNKVSLRKRRRKRGEESNSQSLLRPETKRKISKNVACLTLTLNEVEAKYFSGRARD